MQIAGMIGLKNVISVKCGMSGEAIKTFLMKNCKGLWLLRISRSRRRRRRKGGGGGKFTLKAGIMRERERERARIK
jgi:hypothetical protein